MTEHEHCECVDRVRALCVDEWGALSDTEERCALCRRKWSKHTDDDFEHHCGMSDGIAAFAAKVRAALGGGDE